MIKKILPIALITFMVLSFNTSFAEMNDAKYHAKIENIHREIKDAYNDCIHKKNELRKNTLEALGKLGHTEKDKEY